MLEKFLKKVISSAKSDWQKKAEGYALQLLSPTIEIEVDGNAVKFVAFLIKKREGSVEKLHTVLIGKKEQELFIRCGVPLKIRPHLQEMFYNNISFCYGHNQKAYTESMPSEKVCHHTAWLANYLLNNPDAYRHIAEALDTKEMAVPSVSSPLEIAFSKMLPVLIYGQTGSGKTHQVLEFVAGKNLPLFQINMSSGLEDTDLLAKFVPDPETKGWRTIDGELWRAFKEAQKQQVVVLIEELTRSSKSVRNLLLKAMDEKQGKYTLQNFVTGEQISVPRENIFWIGTANIGYADTEELDPALMRRFLIVLHQGYNRARELEILTSIFGDSKKSERFYRMVVEPIRKAYDAGRLRQPLDTGTLKVFAELYHTLQDIKMAAQLVIINKLVDIDSNGLPSSEQQKLLLEVINNFEE